MDATRAVLLFSASLCVSACNDGEVRYGPPGGLRIRGDDPACPPPDLAPSQAECATVGWAGSDGVFAKHFDADTAGACTLGPCHQGPDDPTGVNMVAGDAAASYAALAAFTAGDGGYPYISTNLDDSPYLLCNINPQSAVIVGSIMPKGKSGYTPEALAEIELWVACGMENDAVGEVSAPGGSGGIGGAAGAGGAGGA